MEKVLIIFNREPYDNTDVTWNGLRLAETLRKKGQEVRIFLMNDAVDMARDVCKPPVGYDQDLAQMLRDLITNGVPVEVCGTCMARRPGKIHSSSDNAFTGLSIETDFTYPKERRKVARAFASDGLSILTLSVVMAGKI
jgi:uncharacterized protein involved in oxidation of intracellular sulfur